MATSKEPKTRCNGTMTDAQFWAFVRSTLRQKSQFWKPRNEAAKRASRPYKGTDKRQKIERQCNECKGWFKVKETAINHIIPCGSTEDLRGFTERLFCESDGFEVLCTECHSYLTYSQNNDCTLEEAKAAKPFIDFSNLKAEEQKKHLTALGVTSKIALRNADNRLQAFKEILK